MWMIEAIAKIDIPLGNEIIKQGTEITITHGKNEKYALWHHSSIWDLPEEYVIETDKVYSKG